MVYEKTRQENYVIDSIGVVYVENKIGLSWLIKQGIIYDENQIRQRRDLSYWCGVCQKWN